MARKAHLLAPVLCTAILLCGNVFARDTLTLVAAEPQEGIFEKFEADKFHFKTSQGETLVVSRMKVSALTLDPPTEAKVQLKGKNPQDALLKGYEKGSFLIEKAGAAQQLAGIQIGSVRMTRSWGRQMEDRAEMRTETAQTLIDPSKKEIKEYAVTGSPTVVHIHLPTRASSVRQGSYLDSVIKGGKYGKIQVVRLEISGFDDPFALQHKVVSAPQFWFFNRQGNLTKQLLDRFTDADIEAALKLIR